MSVASVVDAKDRRYKADGMSRHADNVVVRNRLVLEILISMMIKEWGVEKRKGRKKETNKVCV